MIVRVIVVEWDSDPLVPVMVTVNIPRLSPELPWNVSVEVPDPVTEAGLKVSVTPVTDDADSETVPVNPFSAVILTVTDPDPVRWIVRLVGETLMLKSGGGGAVTVRL